MESLEKRWKMQKKMEKILELEKCWVLPGTQWLIDQALWKPMEQFEKRWKSGETPKKLETNEQLHKNWKNGKEENPKTETEKKLERIGPGGTPSSKTGNQWKSSDQWWVFTSKIDTEIPCHVPKKNSEQINAKSCVICAYYGANHKFSETLLGRVYWPLEIGEV